VGGLLLILWVAGCDGSKSSSTPTTPQAVAQTYFAPLVAGAGVVMNTYSFDATAATFWQTGFPSGQPGSQVLNAGVFSVAQRGLRSLGISTTYVYDSSVSPALYSPHNFNPPEPGSFAVELSGQAGGFVQLFEQPVEPLVAATQCPNFSSAQNYQFITIPGALIPAGADPARYAWDPTAETAYGSVDISSNGSSMNFQNIRQFTLPSVGGTGAPAQPPPSSLTGICGPTNFGNTIVVPGQAVITSPGATGNIPILTQQATIGIGPSGLLVEDNGSGVTTAPPGSTPVIPYNNVLGAGTGAVGLPKPSAALDTGAMAGTQYLGFIYGAGIQNNSGAGTGWSSHLASFGFPTLPSGCASVATKTSTLIYGGDFPNDDPSTSPDGFGNCDFAIDLGAQDSSNNGLYPHATVWVGAAYAANSTGATYPFSAVAIAGQLNGKYAIFLIGTDSSQPWAIYLLQSN